MGMKKMEILRGIPAFKKARMHLQRPSPRILRFRESRRVAQLLHRMDNSRTSPPGGQDVQDLTPGTHFDSFLVIAPAAEGCGRRDYARGLLSHQWNMRFP